LKQPLALAPRPWWRDHDTADADRAKRGLAALGPRLVRHIHRVAGEIRLECDESHCGACSRRRRCEENAGMMWVLFHRGWRVFIDLGNHAAESIVVSAY
jgi:hypothetical protein